MFRDFQTASACFSNPTQVMKRNALGLVSNYGLPSRQYRCTCFCDAFVFIDRATAHADAADDNAVFIYQQHTAGENHQTVVGHLNT